MDAARWFLVCALALFGCSQGPARTFAVERDAAPAPTDLGDNTPLDVPATGPDDAVEVDRGPLGAAPPVVLPGAPPDAAMHFGGADDPSRAPSFVYPDDGTVTPPNLPSFEIHFMPGGDNDLFELSFTGAASVQRVYTGCTRVNGGCVATLDEATFAAVAAVARTSGTVRLELRGTRAAAGAGVGTATARTLHITQTALQGGVYYWSAISGSIIRFEFGHAAARPEVFLTGNVIACVGCHSLSRDGSRIAVGHFIPGPATAGIYDVATRTQVGGNFGSNFGTFSADNLRYLSSDGARLALLDATTAMPAPGLADGTPGTMPDWSPDNSTVVFARPAMTLPLPIGTPGHSGPTDLMLMAWSAGAFRMPTTLVHSAGENNYYPSFSPDGQWVLFNRSSMSSDDAPDAHLWAVHTGTSPGGVAAPVDLARANGTPTTANSWPKWAPFVETDTGDLAGPLLWITFSSRRDYGLRLRQSTTAMSNQVVQLWMAAFRPGHVTPDPTAPAFWLPFQDLTTGNHIAQWVREVRRHECSAPGDCSQNETCLAGRCIGAPP